MTTVSELDTLYLTGDVRIDSLLDSVSPWNFLAPYRNTLYFTFDASNGSYIDDETSSPVFEFNTSQKNAARAILSYASGVTGINFVEVGNSDAADIHFGATDLQGSNVSGLTGIAYGYTHFNGNIDTLFAESTIWLDNAEFNPWNSSPTAGSVGYEVLLHEIGHMLGLGHPFDAPNTLPSNLDNTNNTVMSYTQAGSPKSSFQQYDLWALTWIYGEDGLGGTWGYNSTHGVSLDPSGGDITAPTVLTFSPVDGSDNVDVDTSIQITFSETVARGTGNITLKTGAGQTIEVFNAATSPALNISGSTLTVTPSSPLAEGTEYKLELPSGSILDLAGNPFKGTTTYNFTTEIIQDTIIPVLDGVSPFDGSTNVSVTTDITLSFNENIAAGTGTIVLRTAGGVDVASWNMASGANLTISADNLTLELDQNLAHGTQYVLHIPAGAIEDLAGNSYGGTSVYDFTTAVAADTTAPAVTQFSPADNALNVAINTSITVRFSETILPGSANIILQTASGTVIETFDPATSPRLVFVGNRLTLSPSSPLDQDTEYSLVFQAGSIKDQAGNGIAAITTYGFTTVPPSAPADDFAADQSTTGELPIEGEISGELEVAGDKDWFRIDLSAGENYQFDLLGSHSGQGTLGQTGEARLILLDDQGNTLRSANGGAGSEPSIQFAAQDSGTYYLSAEGLNGSETGSYTLAAYRIENNPAEGPLFIYGNALPNDILLAETRAITDSDGLGSFNYQWLRDGEAIVGATASTYLLKTEDIDQAISVRVDYVDGAGFDESLVSATRIPTMPLNEAYTQLIEMYVIILGRAPAQAGLEFWSSKIDDGRTFEDVAEAMWNSPGAQGEYPPTLSDEEKVTTVYRNVLAREPNEEGLQFWLERWQNDDIGPVGTMLAMINALTANNSSDPLAIQDKVLFEAKVDIGGYLATSVGNEDIELAAEAFDFLEAGQSIEETRAYIDTQMAIIGQANLLVSDDLSA